MLKFRFLLTFVFLFLLALSLTGCGTSSSSSTGVLNPAPSGGGSGSGSGGSGGGGATAPKSQTVFVIVLENKNYADVVQGTSMPFFQGLFAQGTLATQYFADTHPSIGNYLMMTTGQMETNDDSFTGVISDDNLVREAIVAGKSWKVYAESLPAAGQLTDGPLPYLRRHNIFTYFSDVQNDPKVAANVVPLTQLSADLGAGALPNIAFIIPNALSDGHDCVANVVCTPQQEMSQSDDFLKAWVPNIVGSAQFQAGGGFLAIVYDESGNDMTHGGGQVAALFLGPNVKAGFQSTTPYQHENLLRTVSDLSGITPVGNASQAAFMSDLFT